MQCVCTITRLFRLIYLALVVEMMHKLRPVEAELGFKDHLLTIVLKYKVRSICIRTG